MEKTFGAKLWSAVQYGCVFYVGQQILSVLNRKVKTVREQVQQRKLASDKVDLSSEDSFPASDPPAWGGGQATAQIH